MVVSRGFSGFSRGRELLAVVSRDNREWAVVAHVRAAASGFPFLQ